jgi:hypothetical protein
MIEEKQMHHNINGFRIIVVISTTCIQLNGALVLTFPAFQHLIICPSIVNIFLILVQLDFCFNLYAMLTSKNLFFKDIKG